MNLWPRQWWPHTLGAQLVAVTAAAVIISNLAVAAWFELGRERLSVSSQNERLLDRAVSVVTLLAATQPRSREDAVKTLSSGPWQFRLHHDKPPPEPMNEEEASLAARARALLPEARRKEPIIVHIGEPPAGIAVPHRRNPPDAIQVDLPVVRGTRVEMTFFRPPRMHFRQSF